jgi:F-type H+-transporting ATPase subunit epsilon
MKLTILTPRHAIVDEEVTKVTGEADNGLFSLLPGHVDYVAGLVPGLLSYEDASGDESIVAVDEGVLVKLGDRALVSCRDAVTGPGLDELARTVTDRFETLDEQEKEARTALARMEADLVRNLLQSESHD